MFKFKTLEIVLRTHGNSNVHTDRERYVNVPKPEVVKRCVTSLINSANNIAIDCKITVLDDHSTSELITDIKHILSYSKHPTSLEHLPLPGFNQSAYQQFLRAKTSSADLVYSVEDDYLHCPTALTELLDDFELFSDRVGKPVCLYPFDMPDSYIEPFFERSWLVHGTKRHWRTTSWIPNTFMCQPSMLNTYWEPFAKLAREYNKTTVHEGTTTAPIFREHVFGANPIPSLALHMQFDQQKDPYIDWKFWWDNYTTLN